MNSSLFYTLALGLIHRLGPVSARNLIAYCGGAQAVFEATPSRLARIPGIGQKISHAIKARDTLLQAEKEVKFCEKEGIQILSYLDDAYPHALKHAYDGPLILFKKGTVDYNAQPNLAIVGTRKATEYGREQCEVFARYFAERGVHVVSGLAYGIDITAHRASLQAGGMTTAVLGHGLDQVYPKSHYRKAIEMTQQGSLLTEYPSGTAIDPGNFPARNRIISGLCQGVVVIEAAEKGGALITARFAFDQNREVFAVPGRVGDPYSLGCLKLIRDQVAKCVIHPEEVLRELDIAWEANRSEQLTLSLDQPVEVLNEDEGKVLTFLNRGDALIDSIAMHTRMPISQLNSMMLGMEFRGLVKQLPGKKYRKL
jgi:DNA processing protein